MDEKLIEEMARACDIALLRKRGHSEELIARIMQGDIPPSEHSMTIARACAPIAYRAGLEEAAAIADAEAAACIEDGSPSLEDWKSASEGIAAVIRALPEG